MKKLSIVKLGLYSFCCGIHAAGMHWLPSVPLAVSIAIGSGALAFVYAYKLWEEL